MKKNIKKSLSFLGGIATTILPVISLAGSCGTARERERERDNYITDAAISAFVKDLDYTNQTFHDFNINGINTTLDQFLIDNGQVIPESFKGKLQNAKKVKVLKEAGSTEVEFRLKEPIKVKFKYFTEDKYVDPLKTLLKKVEGMTKIGQYKKDFTNLEVPEELVSVDSHIEFLNYDSNGKIIALQAQPELRKDFALYVSKLKNSEDMTFHLKRTYAKDKEVQFEKKIKPVLEIKPIIDRSLRPKSMFSLFAKSFIKKIFYASKLSKNDIEKNISENDENSMTLVYNDGNEAAYLGGGFKDAYVFFDNSKLPTQIKKANFIQKLANHITTTFTFTNYKIWNQITLIFSKLNPEAINIKIGYVYEQVNGPGDHLEGENSNSPNFPILAWKMETSDIDAMDWKNAIKINPELNAEENIKWKDTAIYLRTIAGSETNYYMVLEFDKEKIKVINTANNEVRYLVPNKELNGKKEIVISKEVVDNFADSYDGEYQKLDSASFIFD